MRACTRACVCVGVWGPPLGEAEVRARARACAHAVRARMPCVRAKEGMRRPVGEGDMDGAVEDEEHLASPVPPLEKHLPDRTSEHMRVP